MSSDLTWNVVRSVLLAPIAWPISLLLDWTLGRDIGNFYSQEELKHLMYAICWLSVAS